MARRLRVIARRTRLSRGRLAFAIALASASFPAACTDVRFVPSRWSPQGVQVRYAQEEDLTVLSWSVECNACDGDLVFELADAAGHFAPVDFQSAPYPSGPYECEFGTCVQLVMRGRLPRLSGLAAPVRSRHRDEGLFPGGAARQETLESFRCRDARQGDVPCRSMSPVVTFSADNRMVTIDPQDALVAPGLRRQIAYAMWPTTTGNCAAEARLACDAGTLTKDVHPIRPQTCLRGAVQSLEVAEPGNYCVSVRAVPRDGKDSTRFTTLAITVPETSPGQVTYTPAAQASPVLVQMLLDLDVPDGAACDALRTSLLTALRSAFFAVDPQFLEFPLVELSPGCTPAAERKLDSDGIAARLTDEIIRRAQGTGVPQRVVLFYANNSDSAVPASLLAQLGELPLRVSNAVGNPRAVYTWAALGAGAGALPADARTDFTELLGSVDKIVGATLPFQSGLASAPTPLLDPMSVAGWERARAFVKLCRSTLPATLALGDSPANTTSAAITSQLPPGVLVDLRTEVTVPRNEFQQRQVVVPFEICGRFCDHPALSPAGTRQDTDPWRTSSRCARDEQPAEGAGGAGGEGS